MKKTLLFCIFILIPFLIQALEAFTFARNINVYDYPNGHIIAILLPNEGESGGLIVDVIDSKNNWLAIDLGSLSIGWVEVGSIALNTRNYDATSFCLYKEAKSSSSIIARISLEQTVILLGVCNQWALVQAYDKDKVKYIGWLESEMQCGNPYTTCP